MSSDTPTAQLDFENPWPGLDALRKVRITRLLKRLFDLDRAT
jgi:hypothetical protein